MTPPAHSGAEDSLRLLLTKNPARSFSCLAQFPRLWQTVGPVSGPAHFVDSSLAFFKECTVTSDKQRRSGSEPRPPARRRRKHPYPSWSGITWPRIVSKIIETLNPYHDDNVMTQSAGLYLVVGSLLYVLLHSVCSGMYVCMMVINQ